MLMGSAMRMYYTEYAVCVQYSGEPLWHFIPVASNSRRFNAVIFECFIENFVCMRILRHMRRIVLI